MGTMNTMRLATVWMMFSLVLLSGFGQFVICSEGKETYSDNSVMRMMNLGGHSDSKNDRNGGEDIDDIARFAVKEHNKQENGVLELVRVLKATEQVVAGKLHHLTLEVMEAGKKKIYEAKVWEKPWMNFKQLQEFKKVSPSFTISDLGLKPDDNGFHWRSISTKNPEVQEAAKHAMKSIQQKSNSLHHYKHIDVILARAKMVEDHMKFELLLKLERNAAMKLISLRHVWSDGNGFDWRSLSTKNPDVQEAAKHAMKSIQHKSNSLYPYKLTDIILARAKMVKDHVNFELLLKIERGNKLEKLVVKAMKNHNGKYQ